jgi:dephospho-CoA kinase
MHGPIPVVGLTGCVGGGKSAAARLLAARGAVVIDADAVGHEVLERPEVRDRVAARFGPGVLKEGPRVDRRALGKIVFADASARRDLEAIVHPLMFEEFRRTIADAERGRAATLVALDAAILLESGWDRECDLVVFVDAPRADRLARVGATRGWSGAEFDAREAAQDSCESKRRRADYVLPNAAGPDALAVEVDRFLAWLAASDAREQDAARRPPPPREPSGVGAGAS